MISNQEGGTSLTAEVRIKHQENTGLKQCLFPSSVFEFSFSSAIMNGSHHGR